MAAFPFAQSHGSVRHDYFREATFSQIEFVPFVFAAALSDGQRQSSPVA